MQTILTFADLKKMVNSMNNDQLCDPILFVGADKLATPVTCVARATEDVDGVNVETGRYEKLLECGQAFLA